MSYSYKLAKKRDRKKDIVEIVRWKRKTIGHIIRKKIKNTEDKLYYFQRISPKGMTIPAGPPMITISYVKRNLETGWEPSTATPMMYSPKSIED